MISSGPSVLVCAPATAAEAPQPQTELAPPAQTELRTPSVVRSEAPPRRTPVLRTAHRPAVTQDDPTVPDTELVRRFNAGDETAFVLIIERHREKLFSVCLVLLRNRHDAEEVVQDTFIRAHRGLARFRGDSSLNTWLHRIAVNLSRNRYWYFFRRRRHASFSIDDCPLGAEGSSPFSELIASSAPSPVREATTAEFSALIARCMAKLSAPQREVLTLRNLLSRSYEEISASLGINVGTVKSRIARARLGLRELIAQECPDMAAVNLQEWFSSARPEGKLQTETR